MPTKNPFLEEQWFSELVALDKQVQYNSQQSYQKFVGKNMLQPDWKATLNNYYLQTVHFITKNAILANFLLLLMISSVTALAQVNAPNELKPTKIAENVKEVATGAAGNVIASNDNFKNIVNDQNLSSKVDKIEIIDKESLENAQTQIKINKANSKIATKPISQANKSNTDVAKVIPPKQSEIKNKTESTTNQSEKPKNDFKEDNTNQDVKTAFSISTKTNAVIETCDLNIQFDSQKYNLNENKDLSEFSLSAKTTSELVTVLKMSCNLNSNKFGNGVNPNNAKIGILENENGMRIGIQANSKNQAEYTIKRENGKVYSLYLKDNLNDISLKFRDLPEPKVVISEILDLTVSLVDKDRIVFYDNSQTQYILQNKSKINSLLSGENIIVGTNLKILATKQKSEQGFVIDKLEKVLSFNPPPQIEKTEPKPVVDKKTVEKNNNSLENIKPKKNKE